MKKRILVFSALLILSSCQLQKAPALEKELDQLLEKRNSVGLSVAVVKDGEIIYSGAFGKKNLEEDLPLQTSDLFRIASISKSFSATAIMQLVEEGRISLEDDVSNLIGFRVRNPAYPDEVITLEMLLSHRSGISDKNGSLSLAHSLSSLLVSCRKLLPWKRNWTSFWKSATQLGCRWLW